MASPGLDELVSTTLRNRRGKLADNISKHNALYFRMNAQGNVDPFDGGRELVEELEYAENSSYTRYSGYDNLNIQPSEVFSAATYAIRQVAVSVSINGLEMIQNSGREQTIHLLNSRIKNAERTLVNNLSFDIYSDGTADGGKQVDGLQSIVADDPTTGTVGGIDRQLHEFWRNGVIDFTSDIGTPGKDTILPAINRLVYGITRNNDKPDLIVADNNYWLMFLDALQDKQRFNDSEMADAGFSAVKYNGVDVVFDGGLNGNAPENHMYALNTNYIKLRPYNGVNMSQLGLDRFSNNQDAMLKFIGWAGNVTCSNPSLQGVLKD